MNFKPYQHIERLGTTAVQNIELGTCHVFPKIDGSNGSIWLGDDGQVKAGSRNRELTLEEDNHGFYAWVLQQPGILSFLKKHPSYRLFGEWLVPHSLKTYRNDCWRKFYVFDVTYDLCDGRQCYVEYEQYAPALELHGLDYICPICIIKNGSYEQFVGQLAKNVYLLEDGKGAGEGIVVKRYDFVNKHGHTIWAKLVTSEFKEKHAREMGASELKGKKLVEEEISQEFVTQALVEKEYAKIENSEGGFTSRKIPQLLNTVFYCVVTEESWNFVKKHKNPTIDYKRLQHFVFSRVKELKPELF